MRRLALILAGLNLGMPLSAQDHPTTSRPIRVAVYGGGTSGSRTTVLTALEKFPGVRASSGRSPTA